MEYIEILLYWNLASRICQSSASVAEFEKIVLSLRVCLHIIALHYRTILAPAVPIVSLTDCIES